MKKLDEAQEKLIIRVHSQSTIRRTAETAALRMVLTDHLSSDNKSTVVICDLNDDPDSNTLTIITEQPNMPKNATGGRTCFIVLCNYSNCKVLVIFFIRMTIKAQRYVIAYFGL